MNSWMKSFVDEMLKIAGIVGNAASAINRHKKGLATLALGGAGVLGAQRVVQDVRMGEQQRKMMEQMGR